MRVEFEVSPEEVFHAVRHGAWLSYPTYKAALPWYSRFIGPLTILDVLVYLGASGVYACFRPWPRDPTGAAISTGVFMVLFGVFTLVVRLLSRAPARTPGGYVRLVEKLVRRARSRDPNMIRVGAESMEITGDDLVLSSANGTAVVPLASIDRIDVTPEAVFLVRGQQVVAGAPCRAFRDASQLSTFLGLTRRPVQRLGS